MSYFRSAPSIPALLRLSAFLPLLYKDINKLFSATLIYLLHQMSECEKNREQERAAEREEKYRKQERERERERWGGRNRLTSHSYNNTYITKLPQTILTLPPQDISSI